MKRLIFALPVLLAAACGNEANTPDATQETGGAVETAETAQAKAEVDAEEAAKRRESQIATWAANFSLSEEQATCLVDNVPWDALVAAEQSPETLAQITACEADPATFAGYGQ